MTELDAAKAYIGARARRATLNRKRTSYSWKQEAEAWVGEFLPDTIPYISETTFLEACRELGVDMQPVKDHSRSMYLALA